MTTEVGRQPWVVYGYMRTEEAVTGASGIPVGYASLVLVYAGLLAAVVWILRRLARAPVDVQQCPSGVAPLVTGATRPWTGDPAMTLAEAPLLIMLVALAAYAVLGGADFGAAFWQLGARGERGAALREHAYRAMGPVWEANHVWLIFVLVICWTAYPEAFASIFSTLTVPLFLAGTRNHPSRHRLRHPRRHGPRNRAASDRRESSRSLRS